ncbi:GTP-binding protein LepA, partial [Lacticaseibacillus rhamnosus]
LLVVDATQGVEAQTLANVYLAIDDDLEIIPVINKVDLPSAQPDVVKEEIEEMIGLDASDAILASGKTGLGVPEILERIVSDIPAPSGDVNAPLQALIFDSVYDDYRGVVLDVRVKEGQVKVGDTIQLMSNGKQFQVTEVGVMSPKAVKRDFLMVGDVGYITASIKTIQDTRVGDTVTLADRPAAAPLKGYRKITPMVYSGLFPVDNAKFNDLREALEKLQLNDAALEFEPETSQALGFGFRCGFLGLLHMDVVQERLERDYGLDLIMTAPSVDYQVALTDGSEKTIDNPAEMPDASEIKEIREPYVKASIMVPNDYVGPVMELSQRKRGEFVTMDYLDKYRVNVIYELPLSEIIYDFFDDLKSSTKGYASLDYEIIGYRQSDLVKMDILLNGDPVDALSTIVHKDFAFERGKAIVARLKTTIPRQQFEIPIQAAIGNKIIARSTVKAYRKNVLAKCYGGDITRKRKLLEKQKAGKKRMKAVGSVEVPQEAFMSILKMNDEESRGK